MIHVDHQLHYYYFPNNFPLPSIFLSISTQNNFPSNNFPIQYNFHFFSPSNNFPIQSSNFLSISTPNNFPIQYNFPLFSPSNNFPIQYDFPFSSYFFEHIESKQLSCEQLSNSVWVFFFNKLCFTVLNFSISVHWEHNFLLEWYPNLFLQPALLHVLQLSS